ncbi:MAG: hypothetical protein IPM24_21745 [Bryobacterales bacterium]|nr:hypothetical protein [Bryobacterales bacterium]
MARKKQTPAFEVPQQVQTGEDANWVYRTASQARFVNGEDKKDEDMQEQIVDSGAKLVAHGMAAARLAMLVSAQVASLPMRMALKFLRS